MLQTIYDGLNYEIKMLGATTGKEEDDVAAKGGVVRVLITETTLKQRQKGIVG